MSSLMLTGNLGRFDLDWRPERPGIYYINMKAGEESITKNAVLKWWDFRTCASVGFDINILL